MKNKKHKILEVVINQIPDFKNKTSIDELILKYFWTGRSSESLRLTLDGSVLFEEANIAYYEFPLDKKILSTQSSTRGFILTVGKKLKCPFYILTKEEKNKKALYIRLYDHKIATLVTLYGDFSIYLDTLK